MRQSTACTRTFGTTLSTFPGVFGAVSAFISRTTEKLRCQGSAVNTMSVFINKNRYSTEPPPYSFSTVITLPSAPTGNSELLRHARVALKRIWQPGTVYKKAGVVFDGLETAGQQQLSLFASSSNNGETREQLIQDLDRLNMRFGSNTVRFAAAHVPQGERAPWEGKEEFRSAAYTTS